jgi:hypothetical protein
LWTTETSYRRGLAEEGYEFEGAGGDTEFEGADGDTLYVGEGEEGRELDIIDAQLGMYWTRTPDPDALTPV